MAEPQAYLAEPQARREGRPALLWLLLICAALLLVEASYGLCTQDDAFISFRYARNLVDGHGLVFNPGELVEGYTNFLWTVLFVPVIALGLDPAGLSASAGMLGTVALLWATWEAGSRRWLAPLLVATMAGLSLEAVQGLETVVYAFFVLMALRDGRSWAFFAGLAALTRPEGYAVFGILWLLRRGRPGPLLLFAGLTVPHLVFRLVYYGDIVPNTFHAKVGGLPFVRGLAYLGETGWTVLPLGVALGLALALALWRRPLPPTRWPPLVRESLALSAFFLCYVIWVGGDFKGTGRFVIPVLGPLALMVQAALWRWRLLLMPVAIVWSIPNFQEMGHFAERFAGELAQRRQVGEFLGTVVAPGDWMAVHAAGVLPYYANRPTLDMWGLNDAHIARATVDDMGAGIAGHERRDYAYVLERAPRIILPEQGLVTPEPMDLGDPGVFGEGFLDLYEPLSLRLDEASLNLWRRRPE